MNTIAYLSLLVNFQTHRIEGVSIFSEEMPTSGRTTHWIPLARIEGASFGDAHNKMVSRYRRDWPILSVQYPIEKIR